jgi:hypothetical protein
MYSFFSMLLLCNMKFSTYSFQVLACNCLNFAFLNTLLELYVNVWCFFQRCARILLDENERIMYLGKMRNPKLDGRQKTQTLENVLKKLKSKKAITCPRCGYINGMFMFNSNEFNINLLTKVVFCLLSFLIQ